MPSHRRRARSRACPMPRVLNGPLPVDRYLAISRECVACDCGAGEPPDDDEIDAPVLGLCSAMRTKTPPACATAPRNR
jgi:hypothetical protein